LSPNFSNFSLFHQASIWKYLPALQNLFAIFLTLIFLLAGIISLRADVSVTTSSSKGWSRTIAVNNLGLATGNTLSGTGIPTTGLAPTWRTDGSLESVSLTIGGDTHAAAFNPDGTLSSLTAPGRGNILGGHSIGNGIETLTIDGVTVVRTLDGTDIDIGGGETIGRNEKLTATANGYQLKTKPDVGVETDIDFNAATAPTAKTYAAGPGEAYGYHNELLKTVSIARGGQLVLDYTNDGAKDLQTATWPAAASGPFTISGIVHGFTYTRSGQIKTLGDPSGSRTLDYQNGRLASTTYTAGALKGYEIRRHHDAGRHTGTSLHRDGNPTPFHDIGKVPNGASDQIASLASGAVKVVPQRDAAGRITGYQWGNATGTFIPAVTQTWTRGPGGRIEAAYSDVPGAPSFGYLLDTSNPGESFDPRGRRLKCETEGGIWTYEYGLNGQLSSASHPALGTFHYHFDAIGRRAPGTDPAHPNFANLLNQTTDWEHDQDKTLTVRAHPGASVWFNGVEVENFTGSHSVALTPPGPNGGWVEWETLAVLEGAGEGAGDPPLNPYASPDAKAEKRGGVWIPPTQEEFTFDAAGNRESSAQWDYGWDAKNQLARARTKDHTTAPQAYDINFTYDSEGRRVRKHVVEFQNGAVFSEKIVTFIWDGWDLLYERHQHPGGLTLLERKYLWGPDIADGAAGGAGGLLLIQESRGGTTSEIIPLYDGTGHVVCLTDINKNLLAEYAYGPFGERIHATGPLAQSNPWRYATKYLDEETGLYYFGHRYLDPITGQFLSRDPLGENESINLYQYCGGDPINRIDVLGLESVPVYRNQIAQAMAQLGWTQHEHEVRSRALDSDLAAWFELFAAAEAAGDKPDGRLMDAVAYVNALGHELNDARLDTTSRWAHGRSHVANAGIDRIYKQVGFLEWVSGREPGSLDPATDPEYFDDKNPAFRADEWRRRWIQFNPGGKIAREGVNGNYGAMSYEFGKEVAIWSSLGVAGEFVGTGRVVFGATRGGTGGGVSANFVKNTRLEVEALQMQGLSRAEAFAQIRSFGAGHADGYLFHFTTPGGARGIIAEGVIKPSSRGVWGPGVYSGTTPTPGPFLKNLPYTGWGLGGKGASVRVPFRTTQPSVTPWLPPKTRVFRKPVHLGGGNL